MFLCWDALERAKQWLKKKIAPTLCCFTQCHQWQQIHLSSMAVVLGSEQLAAMVIPGLAWVLHFPCFQGKAFDYTLAALIHYAL